MRKIVTDLNLDEAERARLRHMVSRRGIKGSVLHVTQHSPTQLLVTTSYGTWLTDPRFLTMARVTGLHQVFAIPGNNNTGHRLPPSRGDQE